MGWDFGEQRVVLSASSKAAIERLGFSKPTPVQACTIPLFLAHKDVVVEAVTGSGKTLAFLIPIVEILSPLLGDFASLREDNSIRLGAIVISPTRELALQTAEVLKTLLEGHPQSHILSQLLLIGGMDISHDVARIKAMSRSVDCAIAVATPGRLLALLEKGHLDVKHLEVLVLDEADRLLTLGFERTLNAILERLPKQRRTGLFSATMSTAGLTELVRTGLRNPRRITVTVQNKLTRTLQSTPDTLATRYALCEYEFRLPFVLAFLAHHPTALKAIVYFGTCATVDYFSRILDLLAAEGVVQVPRLFALHGKMEHKKRARIYHDFISATDRSVLLCTDLAARGLDFTDVQLVVQYEAPQDPTTFVHRCGRTARSGREGEALVLLSEAEDAYVEFLSNRKTPLTEYTLPDDLADKSLFEHLRRLNAGDRDLYEQSTRAFVAFIRFYQEHHARFIFRLQDLHIAGVARSYGLLRLPKMRELQGINFSDFKRSSVDLSAIRYKDSRRNEQRPRPHETLKTMNKVEDKRKTLGRGENKESRSLSGDANPLREKARTLPRKTSKASKMGNAVDLEELEEDWKEFKRAKRSK